ncbi:MAG TPA: hypothetical protein DCW55_03410 [Candidatus Pacebacteria bacterium]|nr:hypothetical protein [Candidatus Paceibacterota bacterium]HAX01785.1 hypothetical protein [Candidatus Paceibacterota bacterium]
MEDVLQKYSKKEDMLMKQKPLKKSSEKVLFYHDGLACVLRKDTRLLQYTKRVQHIRLTV